MSGRLNPNISIVAPASLVLRNPVAIPDGEVWEVFLGPLEVAAIIDRGEGGCTLAAIGERDESFIEFASIGACLAAIGANNWKVSQNEKS